MNEHAITIHALQFQTGPLFWVLAVAVVVASFVVVGRESARATRIGMLALTVSLGGLFAMVGAFIPAILFVIPGIVLFVPSRDEKVSSSEGETLWHGVRPSYAVVACMLLAILTVALVQGTHVWLYADKPAQEATIARMWAGVSGTYLIEFVCIAIILLFAITFRRRHSEQENL